MTVSLTQIRKKFFAFSLLLVFIPSFFLSPQCAYGEKKWQDIPIDHVYIDSLEFLKNKDIIHGYDDQTFRPDNPISRVEALKLIFTALEVSLPEDTTETVFSDVEKNIWYVPFVNFAQKKNIVKGYDNGTFKPGGFVTRAEFLKILFEALYFDSEKPAIQGVQYADLDKEYWLLKYIHFFTEKEVLPEEITENDNFFPNKPINRALAAHLIYMSVFEKKLGAHQEEFSQENEKNLVDDEKEESAETDENQEEESTNEEVLEENTESSNNETTSPQAQEAQQKISEKQLSEGFATFYGDEFQDKNTASGEIFDQEKQSGAHPYLPFGTKVKVINTENQQEVVVHINDCGPFSSNHERVIDLSKSAFTAIGETSRGVIPVTLHVLEVPEGIPYRDYCSQITNK